VRTLFGVEDAILVAQHLCFETRDKEFAIDEFVAKAAVEALNIGVLPGSPRLDVAGCNPSLLQMLLHRLGHQLRPVVGAEVPHPSRINAVLRCRLPAVEEATLPVRRFFRFGPKQFASTGDRATAAQTSGSEGSMSGLGQPSETGGGEAVTRSASCSGEAVVSVGGTVVSSEPYDKCPSASDGGGIGQWEGGGLSQRTGTICAPSTPPT